MINGLNLVPIIAVDFSLANLTFNEQCYCLHTLKQGQPNDYIEALRHVSRAFSQFSRYQLAYGVGARTEPGEGPACDLFSMTGDPADPNVDSEEQLVNSYKGTLKAVKLALPVKFKRVFQHVCELGAREFGETKDVQNVKNYYVLIILMAGVIDDIDDSFT